MKNISKRSPITGVSCPKCKSTNLWRYGHHPKTKEQKYKCKNCSHQFVPGRQKHLSPRTNHGLCPNCGRKLEIRKTNKNTIQLRCSGRPFCRYSISKPINLTKSLNHFANNTKYLKLPKFLKYPLSTVISCLKLYFKFNLSSRQIKKELLLSHIKVPSHVTILNWITRFAYYFSLIYTNNLKSINIPKISTWAIDETVIKINGIKYHLFLILDLHTSFVIAWYLSPTKDLQSTLKVIKLALNFTKHPPDTIISDHAQQFTTAIQILFNHKVNHFTVSLFQHSNYSNNKIERFFSTIKQNFKKRLSPKSYISTYSRIFISIFLHNFFAASSNSSTSPAASLNIKLNIKDHLLNAFKSCFLLTYENHF